ncbi:hypothetical protein KIPB_006947 [Kipferlia bialata]|uniref:Kelch-type beta propeller n=1 Tax=Kipferlia bialata TaxID=797122 RepID=A0A9K3GIL9_9EUKA|nr:hypothetical protein KIPB_006947 [Kipferlia bialata]|eukprot:g6947.t1
MLRVYDPVTHAMVLETEQIECPLTKESHPSNSFDTVRLRDKVYVVGGSQELRNQYFVCVWSFDIATRKWAFQGFNSDKPGLVQETVFVYEDNLYVTGTRKSPFRMLMYAYDPEREGGAGGEREDGFAGHWREDTMLGVGGVRRRPVVVDVVLPDSGPES